MHSVEAYWTVLDTSSLPSFLLCLAFVFATAASLAAVCSFCPKITLRRWKFFNSNDPESQVNSVTLNHQSVHSVSRNSTSPTPALDLPIGDGFYDGDMMYETIPEETVINPHQNEELVSFVKASIKLRRETGRTMDEINRKLIEHTLARIRDSLKHQVEYQRQTDVASPTPVQANLQRHPQRNSEYRTREECPDLTSEEVDAMYAHLDQNLKKEKRSPSLDTPVSTTAYEDEPPPVPEHPFSTL